MLELSVTPWIQLPLFLRVFYFPFLHFSNSLLLAAAAVVSGAAASGPVPLAQALAMHESQSCKARDAEKEDFANDLVF